MRTTIYWLLIAVATFAVIGLMIWAHGPKDHEGDEIGSHGGNVYTQTHVDIVP